MRKQVVIEENEDEDDHEDPEDEEGEEEFEEEEGEEEWEDEEEGEEEGEDAPDKEHGELQVGEDVMHDLLGKVTVVKLESEELHHKSKILVKLPKDLKRRRLKESERWVFQDACTRLENATKAKKMMNLLPPDRPDPACPGPSSSSDAVSLEDIIAARGSSPNSSIPLAPMEAAIMRKRKLRKLREAKKRARRPKMGVRMTKEPKVSADVRVAEFPENSLRVSNGEVYCDCCAIELSRRKGTIRLHCKGKQHHSNYSIWLQRVEDRKNIVDLLNQDRENNPEEEGGCVSEPVQEFRLSTVRTLMGTGIPLSKIDAGLGVLLTRASMSVGDASTLRLYIPKVRDAELELLKQELADEWMCVVFDGTTRVGEVLAVVVRYCTADFRINYRLIALSTAAKHMSGPELSGMIIRLLVNRIGPHAIDRVVAAARDSCATNGAAMRSLKMSVLPNMQDIMCFSHTLHNCAKHMKLPFLDKWLLPWFQLMAHSHRAVDLWREAIGQTPVLFSKVRWWSRFECAAQQAKFFSSIEGVVKKLEDEKVGESTTPALRSILNDGTSRKGLQLDLAVVLDASIFCEKTYRLEGDRLEMFLLVEDLESIREMGRNIGSTMSTMPNVAAILRQRETLKIGTAIYDWFGGNYNAYFKGKVTRLPTQGDPVYQITFEDRSVVDYQPEEAENALDIRQTSGWKDAKESLKKAFEYLDARLTDSPSVDEPYRLAGVYRLFQAVRVFDPSFAQANRVTPEAIDTLTDIPWLSRARIAALQKERAVYVTAAKDSALNFSHVNVADFSDNVLTFWRTLTAPCTTWREEARRVLCLTVNSASSERVFAQLSAMFEDQQKTALSDYVEGSIMLAYNKRRLGG